MRLLAPRAALLGALLHAHPTARLAGPLLRRRAALMVAQGVSSPASGLEDSFLAPKAPAQVDAEGRERTMVLAAARTAFMFADNDGDGFDLSPGGAVTEEVILCAELSSHSNGGHGILVVGHGILA